MPGLGKFFKGATKFAFDLIALAEGIFLGLVLSVMIGPVFFILLQTSIGEGRLPGLFIAVGALISDILILTVCALGVLNLSPDHFTGKITGIAGILILLVSGISLIKKQGNIFSEPKTVSRESALFSYFAKGFLINSLNPFVFVFWVGIAGFLINKYDYHTGQIVLFSSGIFFSMLVTDVIKVMLSNKIRPHIKTSSLRFISTFTGITLIFYAILLFYRLF